MDTKFKKSDSLKKEIRKWAISLSIILSIVGGIFWYKETIFYYKWIWALAAAIFTLSLVTPLLLKPLYKGWVFFTHAIGWMIKMLFLGVIYYLICVPIGLFLRLLGKDLLDEDFERNAESYWKDKRVKEFDPKEYERQY